MELEEKFFLDSFILEKKKGISLDHLSDGKQIYICSYQFASRQAEILSRTHWDLVVYDEAHKLRNVYKSTPSMASRLKSAFLIVINSSLPPLRFRITLRNYMVW